MDEDVQVLPVHPNRIFARNYYPIFLSFHQGQKLLWMMVFLQLMLKEFDLFLLVFSLTDLAFQPFPIGSPFESKHYSTSEQ